MKRAFALLLIALPAPSMAQVDWGAINRPQPNPADAAMRGFENAQRARAIEEARRQEEARRHAIEASSAAAEEADQLAKTVGTLLAAGDCEGAKKAALVGGNLALAVQAREYCEGR